MGYHLKVVGECEPEKTGPRCRFFCRIKEIFEDDVFDYDVLKHVCGNGFSYKRDLKILLVDLRGTEPHQEPSTTRRYPGVRHLSKRQQGSAL